MVVVGVSLFLRKVCFDNRFRVSEQPPYNGVIPHCCGGEPPGRWGCMNNTVFRGLSCGSHLVEIN